MVRAGCGRGAASAGADGEDADVAAGRGGQGHAGHGLARLQRGTGGVDVHGDGLAPAVDEIAVRDLRHDRVAGQRTERARAERPVAEPDRDCCVLPSV